MGHAIDDRYSKKITTVDITNWSLTWAFVFWPEGRKKQVSPLYPKFPLYTKNPNTTHRGSSLGEKKM